MKKVDFVWFTRILIGIVLIVNIQCAIVFFLNPQVYTPVFELIGKPGEAAIQGFGVLFFMWNVPYGVALIHPGRFRISLYEALTMQLIGLFGESVIYNGLPPDYPSLKNAILRFIIYDGLGLLFLIIATLFINVKFQRENNG